MKGCEGSKGSLSRIIWPLKPRERAEREKGLRVKEAGFKGLINGPHSLTPSPVLLLESQKLKDIINCSDCYDRRDQCS